MMPMRVSRWRRSTVKGGMALLAQSIPVEIPATDAEVAVFLKLKLFLTRCPQKPRSPHGHRGWPVLVFRPIELQRCEAHDDEGAIEQDPAEHHHPAGNGADACALQQMLPGPHWGWMDCDLAIVGDGLDAKDPSIVAA